MTTIIDDMPVRNVGLEVVGKVTEEDYGDVLVPDVGDALGRGDVRQLHIPGKDVDEAEDRLRGLDDDD